MIRVGIIGCGKVGHLHAKALIGSDQTDFIAVWSRSNSSAEIFAKKYDVLPYDDIVQMTRENMLDLVIVCTPHPFHADPTIAALNAGSHVLIEKPMASSLADCDKMLKAAKETNRKLGVVSQRRWYTPASRIKDAIEANKLEKPILGTVNMLGWRDSSYYNADAWRGTWENEGGGVLINQAPHQLDLLLWYMGEISEVVAFWDNLNHPYIEVDDTAIAIVKFINGALGNIVVSNSQKPGIYGKVHVHGENGASAGVQTDGGAMFIAGMSGITEPPFNDLWSISGEEEYLENWVEKDKVFFSQIDPTVYYLERQIEDFAKAIENDKEPKVTGEDGRRTVELITAIYRSQRDKKIIKFPLEAELNSVDFDGRLKS